MNFLKIKLFVIALVVLVAGSAFASSSYNVTIDTSPLSGFSGYLYFDYTPINGTNSTATVSNFVTDGILGSAPSSNVIDGSAVSGSLTAAPHTVTFANTNNDNDYNHAFTFGKTFSFLLSFSTPAAGGNPRGVSTFSLGLFADEGGLQPLPITSQPSDSNAGTVYAAKLMNNGSVTIQQGTPSAVPIPAAAWLLGSGLAALAGIRSRKQG